MARSDEADLQKDVVEWLRLLHVPCFSVPNEGKRSARLGAHYKSMGLMPGVSDLVVIREGVVEFWEFKTATGKQSPAQRDFEELVKSYGMAYRLIRTRDEVLKITESWKLRGLL
jgi:hypothetical protein